LVKAYFHKDFVLANNTRKRSQWENYTKLYSWLGLAQITKIIKIKLQFLCIKQAADFNYSKLGEIIILTFKQTYFNKSWIFSHWLFIFYIEHVYHFEIIYPKNVYFKLAFCAIILSYNISLIFGLLILWARIFLLFISVKSIHVQVDGLPNHVISTEVLLQIIHCVFFFFFHEPRKLQLKECHIAS
jgi:hypothetical protein